MVKGSGKKRGDSTTEGRKRTKMGRNSVEYAYAYAYDFIGIGYKQDGRLEGRLEGFFLIKRNPAFWHFEALLWSPSKQVFQSGFGTIIGKKKGYEVG